MRYPLFLDLTKQSAVVVGAGSVATRKIRTLLRAEATVTVISPQATASIRRLAQTKRVHWMLRRYLRGDLHGARLAIAATDATASTTSGFRSFARNAIAPMAFPPRPRTRVQVSLAGSLLSRSCA